LRLPCARRGAVLSVWLSHILLLEMALALNGFTERFIRVWITTDYGTTY
jgi:hypothetical protein